MKTIKHKFILLSVEHINAKDKRLKVLLNMGSYQLPTGSNDSKFVDILVDLHNEIRLIGNLTDNDGLTFIYSLLPSQQVLQSSVAELNGYDFVYIDEIKDKEIQSIVDRAVKMIGELKGTEFVETIINILPSPFSKRDCEVVARLFLSVDKKSKTHQFFRYLKEQTKPSDKSFFKPTINIQEKGNDEFLSEKKTGAAATMYEIIY